MNQSDPDPDNYKHTNIAFAETLVQTMHNRRMYVHTYIVYVHCKHEHMYVHRLWIV